MFHSFTQALSRRWDALHRRDLFRGAGLLSLSGILGSSESRAAGTGIELGPDIYKSIGVRPLINCRGTLTIIGGSIELPEVRRAKDLANQQHVQIDELMDRVGERLAQLTGAEWGMVSSGCAAAI